MKKVELLKDLDYAKRKKRTLELLVNSYLEEIDNIVQKVRVYLFQIEFSREERHKNVVYYEQGMPGCISEIKCMVFSYCERVREDLIVVTAFRNIVEILKYLEPYKKNYLEWIKQTEIVFRNTDANKYANTDSFEMLCSWIDSFKGNVKIILLCLKDRGDDLPVRSVALASPGAPLS